MRFCLLFLIFFISAAQGSSPNCRVLNSLREEFTVCWNDTHKGWIGNCPEGKCEAVSFLKVASGLKIKETLDSKNPAVLPCHQKKIPIEILRDKEGNEQSFCVFGDKSLIDANAVDRVTP